MSSPSVEFLAKEIDAPNVDTEIPPEAMAFVYEATRNRLVREFHEVMLVARLHEKTGDAEAGTRMKEQAKTIVKMIAALDEERASASN
jgi:23S rRNA maturation mini-RNase III